MADRSVKVRLEADVTGLVSGMRTAGKATQDFAKQATEYAGQHRESVNTLSSVALGAGAVLTGLSLGALKSAADFDQAMSSVEAATMAPQGELEQLRQAALEAGADTKYSANEAAGAIEQLAKAGVSTADILGGGLHGALNLAASDNLDVGEAAEIAASAMTQFGLSGKDVNHIADLLAAGAGKAQGSVHDLGAALTQSGLVASQFGLSIEETVGGLAAFASAGMTGSDAGTSFKTMLQRLSNPTKEAQAQLDALGVTVYDAQGNFVGLSNFAGQLQTAMADLSPEARNAAMSVIFGSDAVRAANVLYSQGSEGIQQWITNVDDSGFAAEQAAARMDNLKGDLEQLRGSLETAFIGAGDGAQSPLRGVVQGITDIVNAFNSLPAAAQSALGMGAGVAGLAMLAVGALGKTLVALSDLKMSLVDLGITAERTGGKMRLLGLTSGVGLAIAGLATIIGGFAAQSIEARAGAEGLADAFDDLTGAAKAGNEKLILDQLNESLTKADWDALKEAGYTYEEFISAIQAGGPELDKLREQLHADWAFNSNAFTAEHEAYGRAVGALDTVGEAYQIAGDKAKENAEQNRSVGEAATMSAEGQQFLDAAIQQTDASLDGVIDDMQQFLDLLFATGLATMSARDAEAQYQESLAGIGETVQELSEKYGGMGEALNETATDFDLTTEAGREANGAFQELAADGMDRVRASAEDGAGLPELQTQLNQTYDDLVAAAGQFGITGEAADALARSVLGVPDGIDVHTWMDDQAKRMAEDTKREVDRLDGRSITITTTFRTIGGAPAAGFGPTNRAGYATAEADGGVIPTVRAFAAGGEHHVAQIAPAGAWRLWAEPETGGEAYIPLSVAKRDRSTAILSDVARRFGYTLSAFEQGGQLRSMPYTPKAALVAPEPSHAAYSPTFEIHGADPSQVVAIADAKAAHHVQGISSWRR